MSLVTVWTNEKFAAVCCDGRLSERGADGRLIPVREDYVKFQALTDTVVLAGTGSEFVFDALVPAARAFAADHEGSPELFKYLEAVVPSHARALLDIGAERFNKPPEVALVLVGFDAAQGRIRCVSWTSDDNLIPVDREQGTGCFGQ